MKPVHPILCKKKCSRLATAGTCR